MSPPVVSAELVGPPAIVFDTRTDSCDRLDIPDANPRAFRDDQDRVHLVSTHFVARAMIGPNLDSVTPNCHVIYRSKDDPDPAHFSGRTWLMSFFSIDGRKIVALGHSEYEAWNYPGMCATPTPGRPLMNCWWNTITYALSRDSGYTFTEPTPPNNLVASLPYAYVRGNRAGAYGYKEPTNILELNGAYYAMLNDWPFEDQRYGPCLIRTTDLLDPKSWRAWDGKDFTISFVDPYREHTINPERHVCSPVGHGALYSVGSLAIHQPSGYIVATQFTRDKRFGPPGLYLSASRDLIHWSHPSLVATSGNLAGDDEQGDWTYDFFSLLDTKSPDRNFATTSDTPEIFYVRVDKRHGPYTRVLLRRRIKLTFGSAKVAHAKP